MKDFVVKRSDAAAMPDAQAALGRLVALVIADEALAHTLAAEQGADQFAKLAIDCAAARGIALDPDGAFNAVRPDPLGIGRWTATPAIGANWPGKDWLPIQVVSSGGQIYVDWAHFGATRLTEPFYEDSIRRALSRPFNRMFRYRMAMDDFLRHADSERSLAPSGFIFHMSRCGSTLVAQMLAAMPDSKVISEAAPIDAMVQIDRAVPAMPADQHAGHLRAMVTALGRRRAGTERHYFIKLDSWHALALPLFARAFPSAPWVFLYRDPVDVLVSQMRERGTQMIPEIVPPNLYGIADFAGVAGIEYCARVLGTICAAAIDHHAVRGGLLVNYRELPDAVFTKILPHFGIACDDEEREHMRRAARYDAKSPQLEFSGDSETKQRQATAEIRAVAERHVGAAYRQLEAFRTDAG